MQNHKVRASFKFRRVYDVIMSLKARGRNLTVGDGILNSNSGGRSPVGSCVCWLPTLHVAFPPSIQNLRSLFPLQMRGGSPSQEVRWLESGLMGTQPAGLSIPPLNPIKSPWIGGQGSLTGEDPENDNSPIRPEPLRLSAAPPVEGVSATVDFVHEPVANRASWSSECIAQQPNVERMNDDRPPHQPWQSYF